MAILSLIFTYGSIAVCGAPATTAPGDAWSKVQRIEFWQTHAAAKRIEDRIVSVPPEILELAAATNKSDGIAEIPRKAALNPGFVADLKAAIRELPPEVHKLLDPYLLAIVLIRGLGSSALTHPVVDINANPKGAFIALDIENLNRRANEWLTWKENKPFISKGDVRIQAELEEPRDNTRKNALQFILLHEFGHVLGFGLRVHPITLDSVQKEDLSRYPFLSHDWFIREGRLVPTVVKSHPQPGKIAYYTPDTDKPADDRISAYYTWLEKTSFPTLYAATDPLEDFAESFATYVHAVLMKKPFRLRIVQNGKTVATHSACWNQVRCRVKLQNLQAYLK